VRPHIYAKRRNPANNGERKKAACITQITIKDSLNHCGGSARNSVGKAHQTATAEAPPKQLPSQPVNNAK